MDKINEPIVFSGCQLLVKMDMEWKCEAVRVKATSSQTVIEIMWYKMLALFIFI